jgi:hypothetical protein
MALGIGCIEKDANKLYSSYLIINNNGNDLINYKRISKGWRTKNSDENFYKEGNKFKIF